MTATRTLKSTAAHVRAANRIEEGEEVIAGVVSINGFSLATEGRRKHATLPDMDGGRSSIEMSGL
jgi:hypothetical protein